jgi:Thermolysin metallopeptidase, alpha-helical domain
MLATKLTSGSTYRSAREGAITSAVELYGADSQTCRSVQAAFDAIAVPVGSAACSGGSEPSPTGGNLLENPGFESGAVSWTGTSGPITTNTGRPARTGSWKMWLGGNGQTATETESQTVSIPATASSATLSFHVRIDTSESSTRYAYDTAKVQLLSGGTTTTLATYSNLDANNTYTLKSLDLNAYRGKTVTVRFLMNEDASLQTSFVVDDTALDVG